MLYSLRFRTWLLLLLGTGAILFIMAWIYYASARTTISQTLADNADVKLAARADALSVWLNTRRQQVEKLSKDAVIQFGSVGTQLWRVQQIMASEDTYSSFGIVDLDGQLKLSDGSELDVHDETAVKAALAGKTAISKPYYAKQDPMKLVISFEVPIKTDDGKVRAVLAATVEADEMLAIQTAFGQSKDNGLFLMDELGDIIYNSQQQLVMPAIRNELALELADHQQVAVGQGTLAYFGTIVPGTNWSLIVQMPTKQLYAPLHALLHRTIWAGVAAELILAILLFLLTNPLINRIKEILKRTEAVAAGYFQFTPLPANKKDEIGALAVSVNGMVEQLRNLFEPLQAVTNQNDYGILVTDENYTIVRFNKTAQNKLGYTEDEVVGKMTPIDLSSAEDMKLKAAKLSAKHGYTIEPDISYMRARIRNRLSYTEQRTYVRKDGTTLPVHLNVSKILDANGKVTGYVGLFRDITKQKQIEAELRLAKQQAERANEAKSIFLAMMSHEVRTPINGIVGLSQLLARTDLNAHQRDYLDKVISSSDVLLGIVNDILDYSKMEAGKFELETISFDLENLFRKLADTLSIFLGRKQIEMIIDISESVPVNLIGDPLRLEQILLNLANNAVKFTEKGYVRLSVSLLESNQTHTALVFRVEDTGIGMSEEQVSQLFRPFAQADGSTSRKYGGTGLGLVIAHELVSYMGGNLEVESEAGTGSRFSFTVHFPFAAMPVQSEPLSLRNRKILCIQQAGIFQESLASLLKPLHADLVFLSSWKEGIALLERDQDKIGFEYVFGDMEMPDMYGLDTWLRLKAAAAGAKTIVMTTPYGQNELMRMPEEQRPDRSIMKPLTRRALQGVLAAMVEEDSYGSRVARSTGDDISGTHIPRILLVDDHKINQQVAYELLTDRGYEVGVAADGVEAVEMLEKQATHWDLVLMDLHMPVMDGYEATDRIRQSQSAWQLPIVAMTANVLQEDRYKCYRYGMNDVMTKPIDPEALFAVVEHWLQVTSIIDWEEALHRVNGKPLILDQMLRTFQQDFADFSVRLGRSLEAGDLEAARKLIHGFKGVVGNLSAKRLWEAASQLEEAIGIDGYAAEKSRWISKYKDLSEALDLVMQSLAMKARHEKQSK